MGEPVLFNTSFAICGSRCGMIVLVKRIAHLIELVHAVVSSMLWQIPVCHKLVEQFRVCPYPIHKRLSFRCMGASWNRRMRSAARKRSSVFARQLSGSPFIAMSRKTGQIMPTQRVLKSRRLAMRQALQNVHAPIGLHQLDSGATREFIECAAVVARLTKKHAAPR